MDYNTGQITAELGVTPTMRRTKHLYNQNPHFARMFSAPNTSIHVGIILIWERFYKIEVNLSFKKDKTSIFTEAAAIFLSREGVSENYSYQ